MYLLPRKLHDHRIRSVSNLHRQIVYQHICFNHDFREYRVLIVFHGVDRC